MGLGTLRFHPRSGTEVAHDLPDGVCLRGEIGWIASGEPADIDALEAALGPMAERVSATHALVRFGNAVGKFRIGGLGQLEARCGKWDEAAFDAMLADLSEISSGLPFAATQWQGLAHDRVLDADDPILLHQFLYVRHIVLSRFVASTGLLPALESILRDPHRRFVVERERVTIEATARADARTLARLAAGGEPLIRVGRPLADIGLARALRGHLPRTVDSPRAYHSADTAENAFVKSFLDQVASIAERVGALATARCSRSAEERPAFWSRLLDDSLQVRRALQPLREHDFWEGVSSLAQIPAASAVLQRRRGYREVLRHYLALRATAKLPLGEEQRHQLLGVKDVASLYELWAFYRVVKTVEEILGCPPSLAERPQSSELQLDVPWGLRVAWGTAVEVLYNLSFGRSHLGDRRSLSITLRPDIVVRVRHGDFFEVHALDAKLRIERLEKGEENELGFKREDIAKMHAYRDALPSVRSACILYPGVVPRFFPSSDSSTDRQGVGAIPLVPGGSHAALVQHLSELGLKARR